MEVRPYQQTLTHSCLAASFLMILEAEKNQVFSKQDEQDIALEGSQRTYPFYVVGITSEIIKKYKVRVNIIVDNKFFSDILKKSFGKTKNIIVQRVPIRVPLIKKLLKEKTLICHVDVHGLGDYSHASHFIVIEKHNGKSFTIIDPWSGKRKRISETPLKKAISELKTEVRMCPLLFFID